MRFLLEDGNVGAAFIDSLEVNGILSMQEFAGLERDRTHMRDVLTGAFGLHQLIRPGPHIAQSHTPRLGGEQ